MAATKSPHMRLGHIRDEIANLQQVVKDVDYSSFSSSYWMVRTTERAILIIAEAAKTLPPELDGPLPWRRVACASRNGEYPLVPNRASPDFAALHPGYLLTPAAG